jgi:hypothetical protein
MSKTKREDRARIKTMRMVDVPARQHWAPHRLVIVLFGPHTMSCPTSSRSSSRSSWHQASSRSSSSSWSLWLSPCCHPRAVVASSMLLEPTKVVANMLLVPAQVVNLLIVPVNNMLLVLAQVVANLLLFPVCSHEREKAKKDCDKRHRRKIVKTKQRPHLEAKSPLVRSQLVISAFADVLVQVIALSSWKRKTN